MRRPFLAALAGVLALFGASVAVIWWATRAPAPDAEGAATAPVAAAPAPAPEPEPPPPAPPPPPVAPDVGAAVAASPPAPRAKARPVPKPMGPPPVAHRILRGGVRGTAAPSEFLNDLELLRGRVAERCPSALQPPGAGEATARGRRAQPVLLLVLEELDGAVRVKDATVQSRGGLDEGALACAQDAVRRQILKADAVKGGGEMRLPFPLVATARPPAR